MKSNSLGLVLCLWMTLSSICSYAAEPSGFVCQEYKAEKEEWGNTKVEVKFEPNQMANTTVTNPNGIFTFKNEYEIYNSPHFRWGYAANYRVSLQRPQNELPDGIIHIRVEYQGPYYGAEDDGYLIRNIAGSLEWSESEGVTKNRVYLSCKLTK